jgi:RNA polymerase sigma-70 factor (ECF subfamily)
MKSQLTPAGHIHLWDSFRSGNREAFLQLYELFAADMYRYGYNLVRNRQVVDDCLHELFLHLYEKRANLGATDNIRFYLFRALRRRLLDTVGRLNKVDSDSYLFTDASFLIQPYERTVIESELVERQKELMRIELNKLPNRQKEILYLVYIKELTYQQAAEVMAITMKSVYNTVNVALATLRVSVRESFEKRGAWLNLLLLCWIA